mgnify:CR=1 FL=1
MSGALSQEEDNGRRDGKALASPLFPGVGGVHPPIESPAPNLKLDPDERD